MATKTDFVTLLEKAQGRWQKYDEEERKKREEEDKKLQQVDTELTKGSSWEDISKKTGVDVEKVKEYSLQTRPEYGIDSSSNLGKLKKKLTDFGYSLGTTPGQAAADKSLEASQEKILRLIQDPNIPVERKNVLMKYVATDSAESPALAAQNTADVTQRTSPLQTLKGVAEGVTNLPADIIERGTRQFRGGVDIGLKGQDLIKAQELAQKLPEDIKASVRGLNPTQQAEILKLVSQGLNETQLRNFVTQAQEEKRKADLEMAGAAVEAASLGVGGGSLVQAAKQGGARQLARTGAETAIAGAGSGAGYELRTNPEATGAEILQSGAVGGGAGLGGAAVISGTGALLRRGRGGTKGVAQELIDESRRLPAYAGQGADVITDKSRLLGTGPVDPELAIITKGADVNDVKRLQTVEKRIAAAQKTSNITPDEARGLMRERQELITRIQSPATPIAREISQVDEAITIAQNSGDTTRARALTGDRVFLQEEAARNAATMESAELLQPDRGFKASAAAKRAEAKAIEGDLTKGFDDLTGYVPQNLAEQADFVVTSMNQNYDLAKRIAMGEVDSPNPNIPASAFYEGVKNRAAKEGDAVLLEKLATQSTVPSTGSKFGQYNAAFAFRDPESPVTAFKAIAEARKTSALDIPRTIAPDEAQRVVSLSQEVATAKNAIAEGGDRLAYGRARIAYDDYVQNLIAAANKKNLKESLKHPVETAVNVAGVTKSLRASLDNSALLRQGWKTMFTHPGTWAKNSLKSFEDFAKAVGGKQTIDEVRADIISRPNSLNGMYKKMKVDVFGIKEEAFPTSLPEKIPVAGRLFKGSEAAYTGFVQRTRADLADKYLEIAQRSGVDLTSKKELQSIGKLVNSLTSRGDLGRTGERTAQALNNVFFSPRLLKSNIDVLTGHQFQRGVTPFVRKRAARNLLQIAVGSAAALKLAQEVTGGKVEWDPRSSNFGKVKVRDTRFDLSGGIASIVTLGARLGTASSKSSTTGEVKKLNTGEFGAQSTLDTIYNFFENKTSPAVSVIRDYLKGQTFEGEKPTTATTIKNLTLPLIIANYQELKDNPRASSVLPTMIAEGLGVSVNTYGLESNWNASNAKRVAAFKESVSKDKFEAANETYNERFNSWYDKVANDSKFWSLPQEKRESLVTSKRDALTEDVMEEQGFKQKRQKKDRSTTKLIEELKKY